LLTRGATDDFTRVHLAREQTPEETATLSTAPNVNQSRTATEALPRPLTPRARRQSWWEPSVRAWWLVAIGITLVLAFQLSLQLFEAHQARLRLSEWRHETVTIDKIDGSPRATYTVSPEYLATSIADMTYTDTAGVTHSLRGHLVAQFEPRHPGEKIELLIDPADPSVYTDRVRPAPLVEQLIIPGMLAPFPLIFAIVALVKRNRTRRLWQDGQRHQAQVVDVQKSAIAPRSAVLRCAVPDSREHRLFRLTIPRRLLPKPQKGDTLDVITPPGEPTRAIAAMMYE
jgi:hypothetical protein